MLVMYSTVVEGTDRFHLWKCIIDVGFKTAEQIKSSRRDDKQHNIQFLQLLQTKLTNS